MLSRRLSWRMSMAGDDHYDGDGDGCGDDFDGVGELSDGDG